MYQKDGALMQNRIAVIILLTILCSFLVSIPSLDVVEAEAEPQTIVVPDDYQTISWAVDNASEGDTIRVMEGTYHENVVINKSISLVGENVDTTVIDGNPSTGYRVPITITCDNVSVSGFKLLYGYAGIQMFSANSCSISGNRIASAQHGISMGGSSYCTITENYFDQIDGSAAIQLGGYSTNNLVTGNYIESCTEGIQSWQNSSSNTLSGNTIFNCDDYAIMFDYSDNNIVTGNEFSYSKYGTSIYVANNNTITNNNYINNTVQFSANESYALTLGIEPSVNTINENYWSDYTGTGSNDDGIGDTPYIIDENNQDSNPLMAPIEVKAIPEFPSWMLLMFMLIAVMVVAVTYKRKLQNPGRCQVTAP
jgi:parallel beta-helix repeat protein